MLSAESAISRLRRDLTVGLLLRLVLIVALAATLALPQFDRTVCTLECRKLLSATGEQSVSGRVRLDINGHLAEGAAGDEVEVVGLLSRPAGPRNPYGGALEMRETTLATERDAQRNLDLAAGRKWIVVNPGTKNSLGHPTGYALLPGENAVPYLLPESWVRKRAGFLNSHLWVTPFDAAEMHAAGDYPYQSRGGDGLPKWTAADRNVENRDLVMWYVMGVTHNPRPEDWPVMPTLNAGFKLTPWGFFARDPLMDLPPVR